MVVHRKKSGLRGGKRISPHEEIKSLQGRIAVETPAPGTIPYDKNAVVAFRSLPLSDRTLQGLESNNYTTMTPIQSSSIPHALAGRDILGAAKTGSGKTLSFLIPILESLFKSGWSPNDGVGAIVLSPTRELAGQIFAVLRKIGKFHSNLTLGLVIGGKAKGHKCREHNEFMREQQAVPTTNILICTPGRILQHLEQTPYFNVDSLQMLVLDEADRILDMGFKDQLTRILEYLPKQRQTLLFSATQTKNVKDLARLSINRKTVEYVGVHDPQNNKAAGGDGNDDSTMMTPDRLQQSYVLCPIEHKLNCVYSFLKSHLRCKTMVFMASCSQVRHAWDLFCRLRPGLSVLALHGKLSQIKRLQVYDKFANTPHCVMFSTDVASRGLDFPNVDWVLQVDAPEDPDMYVHRVGRTARFQDKGQALLLLDPQEEPAVQTWQMKAPLKKKSINPTKTMLVTQRASSLVAEHASLNHLAKKAFQSYTRSLALLPKSNWGDLNVRKLNLEEYALSLGLAAMPNLDFLGQVEDREKVRSTKNINRKLQKLKEQIKQEKELKKAKKKKRKLGDEDNEKEDEEEDLLVFKARHEHSSIDNNEDEMDYSSKANARHPKKIRIDGGNSSQNKHTVFEEDGTEQPQMLLGNKNDSDSSQEDDLEEANESYLEKVRKRLEKTKELDKQEERERIRAKHKKKKFQDKEGRDAEEELDGMEAEPVVTLGGNPKSDDQESQSEKDDDSSSSDSDSSSSSSDDDSSDDEDIDVPAQEDLALKLIRGH